MILLAVELRQEVLPVCQQLSSPCGQVCSTIPQPSRPQQELPGHPLVCMVGNVPLPKQQARLGHLLHPWQHLST